MQTAKSLYDLRVCESLRKERNYLILVLEYQYRFLDLTRQVLHALLALMYCRFCSLTPITAVKATAVRSTIKHLQG